MVKDVEVKFKLVGNMEQVVKIFKELNIYKPYQHEEGYLVFHTSLDNLKDIYQKYKEYIKDLKINGMPILEIEKFNIYIMNSPMTVTKPVLQTLLEYGEKGIKVEIPMVGLVDGDVVKGLI